MDLLKLVQNLYFISCFCGIIMILATSFNFTQAQLFFAKNKAEKKNHKV